MENNVERLSILIVDDEPSNLIALNKILASEFDIYMAKNGATAIRLAARDKPDLILLDILLPDQDGFEVLRQLKECDETRGIPVIFISIKIDDEDEERGFELGAVDYIKKPFRSTIVRARVNTHMQIVRQLRKNEKLGMTDPLTDIPNRRCFDERLVIEWKRAIREKKPLSFLMMDLDYFKDYNDTFGHQQGDTLLKVVSRIFVGAARRASDLAARLGGEEFGVLLPDTTLDNALLVAETIRQHIEEAHVPTADGQTWTSTTISIGAASIVPTVKDSCDDFIAKADERLYAAKAAGRNIVYPLPKA